MEAVNTQKPTESQVYKKEGDDPSLIFKNLVPQLSPETQQELGQQFLEEKQKIRKKLTEVTGETSS